MRVADARHDKRKW